MRIIIEGKREGKTKTFKCKACGCEFECDESEYWIDNNVCLTTYPAQYKIMSNCPCCHKVCEAHVYEETRGYTFTCTTANSAAECVST